jgi:hypothetical protein
MTNQKVDPLIVWNNFKDNGWYRIKDELYKESKKYPIYLDKITEESLEFLRENEEEFQVVDKGIIQELISLWENGKLEEKLLEEIIPEKAFKEAKRKKLLS